VLVNLGPKQVLVIVSLRVSFKTPTRGPEHETVATTAWSSGGASKRAAIRGGGGGA
jgi:hypothetical protein